MKNIMKELEALKLKHKKPGRGKGPRVRANFPDLKVVSTTTLSNTLEKGGHKRDLINQHKWKKGSEEKPETIKEIEAKSKRIRPKFNKGGYSYASDGDNEGDLTIYRK